MTQQSVDAVPSPKADKGKSKVKDKERPAQPEKVQAPLGFRVVKRSSVTSAKGGSGGSPKPRVSPSARVPTPPTEEPEPSLPSKPRDEPAVRRPEQPAGRSEAAPVPVEIAEVPEMASLFFAS